MTEQEITIGADMPAAGAKCVYCGDELQAGDLAVVCPRCKKPHHSRCWKENAGCATMGCPQVAEVVRAEETNKIKSDEAQAYREAARRRRLWIAAIATAVVVGVMIAGFGLGAFGTRKEATDKRTVVTVMLPVSIESQDLARLAEKFNGQSRDSRVEMSFVPFGAYEQKLVVLLAAKDAPDIFALPPDRFEFFASKGFFVALDSLVGRDDQASRGDQAGQGGQGRVIPAMPGDPPAEWLKLARVKNTLYGLPHPRLGQILGIAATSKHQSAAWEFLQFYFASLPPGEMEGSHQKGPQNPQSLPFGPGIF